MKETLEILKQKLSALASKHQTTGDEWDGIFDAEILESDAQDLIIKYCEDNNYQVEGFPHEKMKLLGLGEIDEDYFNMQRYQLYIDTLTLQKEDVSELTWHYVSSFWPDQYESKEDFLDFVKVHIKTGYNETF